MVTKVLSDSVDWTYVTSLRTQEESDRLFLPRGRSFRTRKGDREAGNLGRRGPRSFPLSVPRSAPVNAPRPPVT
ncbi:hypothetical protein COCON_G00136470 [Conger conger]|uniref:Uncharacterized protein n=1 Tax=Conger conger TaxID=82655 RepID=A0A9Q1DFV5_CONCO|nr:hypothetical protein COCON_G00136470 [Conger conger]